MTKTWKMGKLGKAAAATIKIALLIHGVGHLSCSQIMTMLLCRRTTGAFVGTRIMRVARSTVFVFLLISLLLIDGVAQTCLTENVDVVIVGAGMTGISAAADMLVRTPGLTFVVLESTDRIGGRVKSNLDFGENGPNENGKWTVEEGANWLEFDGNEVVDLVRSYGMKTTETTWLNFVNSTYQYNQNVFEVSHVPSCCFLFINKTASISHYVFAFCFSEYERHTHQTGKSTKSH